MVGQSTWRDNRSFDPSSPSRAATTTTVRLISGRELWVLKRRRRRCGALRPCPAHPSPAPLLTWTQGPRWLALPLRRSRLRRAGMGRVGLTRAPLLAPHPVSLVNGGYSWPPARWSRPLPAPTRFSPPAQMLRSAPLTLDYLRNCRRHGPRRQGPSDTSAPPAPHSQGRHPSPGATRLARHAAPLPTTSAGAAATSNNGKSRNSGNSRVCFLAFPLFVVGIFRCGGPSHSVPAPSR